MRRATLVGLVLVAVVAFCVATVAGLSSCTPAQRAAVAPIVEPATELGCIIIRAIDRDGHLSEICAAAEELAPLIPAILDARAEKAMTAATAPAATAKVAFALKAPAVPVTYRRCVQWAPIPSASVDAGAVGSEP